MQLIGLEEGAKLKPAWEELTTLKPLKLKVGIFKWTNFYTDNANGNVLWINTKNKTYTIASLAYLVFGTSGFLKNGPAKNGTGNY